MSGAADKTLREEQEVAADTLEQDGRALAEAQRELERATRWVTLMLAPAPLARRLEQAHRHLRRSPLSDARTQTAAAWFLDNYYLIRRVARQVEEELPRGFVRHLPQLAFGAEKGRPRIDILARVLIAKSELVLDLARLRRFIDGYQAVSPLTIAELWALPTMLRSRVLRHLLSFLEQLNVPLDEQGKQPEKEPGQPVALGAPAALPDALQLDPVAGIERAVRALRVLDAIDWKLFFERQNRVEAILQTDPARVYARMDFATRDAYRKVVEELAWTTDHTEQAVADLAITLASQSPTDERSEHVGYYLTAEGRAALELQLGYRAVGLERVRRGVLRWPTLSYLLPVALLTCLPLLVAAPYVARGQPLGTLVLLALAALLASVPASAWAVSLVQLAFAHLLPPRTLPKLDLQAGLPVAMKTLVVIPTLLGRSDDVTAMLRQVELHYLSNPDPQLQFALLTDDLDAKSKPETEHDGALLESVSHGVAALNDKHGQAGLGPFHLLHREPRWNQSEGHFIGWERKRGKLEELNRLLRGDTTTSYARHVGNPDGLLGIRFVITLDGDTELPMGSAHRLVGLLAHPLNRAVFAPDSGRVLAGYTIVQPRIETSPRSARQTLFSRLFAGDIGFDIYTHACSELYQDLFGAGIYVGKGIYDVDAFMRSVAGRAPENALVSHDLFEGIHGRTGLATDIVLFDSYPESYATYAMRIHRWVRGDWQLSPWLLNTVPAEHGGRLRNDLVLIERWKIADNLRRSLTGPCLLAFLISGFCWLPGSATRWTLFALALLLAPLVPGLASSGRARTENWGRALLALVFLAYDACVVVDAVSRVVVRKAITHKRLLQWTSAADSALRLNARSPRAMFWSTMLPAPLVALLAAVLIAWARPASIGVAAPILLLWLVSPEVARWLSKPARLDMEQVSASERKKLRLLARRTWRFFDVFVGPDDQWLPIDNYQAEPHEQTAHRTSPTNIGLTLVATLSAYDFGYIGPSELTLRIRRAFDSISRMPHYQGHLFNWYDTQNLLPLLPRYVSTVDSGNFAGCLLALKEGCKELVRTPVLRAEAWEGLRDSVDLLVEVVESAETPARLLRAVLLRMQHATDRGRDDLRGGYAVLQQLCEETSAELDGELLSFLQTGALQRDADLLAALRTSVGRLHQHLRQMRRELDALLPWLSLQADLAAHQLVLPTELRLDEIATVAQRGRARLSLTEAERRAAGPADPQRDASAKRLDDALTSAEAHATGLVEELVALAARANEEVMAMDFKLLYDGERKLFHIGYNATVDELDLHHYDLLASEARLASYLAIVKRDVPESHWYALGRPLTRCAGNPALLSWGGTMFEYLMPGLLMKSQAGTLLARTNAAVVDAQIAYGKDTLGGPWGISESAYAGVDSEQTYQYHSFGVPGLGFKRGLEEDRVVTPYASALAVAIRPRAVVANIRALEALGMLGTYGLFEALDLTSERALPQGDGRPPFTIVRSYMAHHQGMLLVALGNFLNQRTMLERFHANPLVATGEALLNERAPLRTPAEWPLVDSPKVSGAADQPVLPHPPGPWQSDEQASRQAFVLSNGRLTSLLTASGGGGLRWQGLALTRYEPDATRDSDGLWLYLRDEDSQRVWLATSAEGRTTYAMHKIEFHLREQGISVHVDVTVAATDDVEVRQVTLHNETDQRRRLTLTSAGRPVLFDAKKAPSHPAFSSLFVESERLTELDALVFSRRPQTTEEEPAVLVHRLVRDRKSVTFAGDESDRTAFFGRTGSLSAPLALTTSHAEHFGHIGAVLDPVMSLSARVTLEPNDSVTLAFVTTVGRSRKSAVELARKYGSMHTVRWAFRDADQESPRRLHRAEVAPTLVPSIQRLFSALLFSCPSLRASSAERADVPPCQQRLWSRGISGDDPIILLRVREPEAPLLSELLAAQRYLRACRVRLDLVLIDEKASGYITDGPGTLRSVLALNQADGWLDRHGGIFVIAADQVAELELRHLHSCASVSLDTRDGSLGSRLGRAVERLPKLPQFERTLTDEVVAAAHPRVARSPAGAPVASPLLFDNGTGGFDAEGREYILDVLPGKPTPAPWCNVLANPQFGCLVSESSLGTSWSLNSGENRLTPWRNDPVFDTPSEALYLRDEETASVWSPTPLPAGQAAPTRVRHGAGYTTYERESHGLLQELTVFVPHDASLKVVRLRVRNTLPRRRRLTATYYAEWVLGSRRETQRPHIVSAFDREHACLLATCDWSAEFSGRVAFLASERAAHGCTADRTEFLGLRGDYARPEALERWGLSGRVELGADPCAALQVHIELAPGQAEETHFVLGQAEGRSQALSLVARFRSREVVETSWQALQTFWDDTLGAVRVKTPEPAMDVMLNRWLLYQTLSARVFGRTGFYQSSGAFGYRDQLQDVLALLHTAPSIARAQIVESARHQFAEGDVLHWWHPPSGRGVRTRCSDDLAWLPYVAAEYVATTGDASILEEDIPFLQGEPLRPHEHDRYAHYETSTSTASLLEHCRRALEHAVTEGAHGLPLMGDGDWNDGMSRIGAEGRGESVWLGWFLCATMDRFGGLALSRGDRAESERLGARAAALRAKIRDVAWDGSWYLRAFHDDGSLVGSASSRECAIDSIAQSWAVLSRGPEEHAQDGKHDGPDARARAAVQAADTQLVRDAERLVLLFWPPFDTTEHDPGYIRGYPPGVRENGGQYTHAATWLGFAHAALGDGERAERIFRLLNPVLRSATAADAARYRVEPYALAGDIYSCPPWVGRGGWSWYTGSAAWMYRLGVEAILGLQQEAGQLRIAPCIPPSWDGFEAWVRVGQKTVHVIVENPDKATSGVASLSLDGRRLDDNLVSVDPSQPGAHEVHVKLGPRPTDCA